MYLTVREIADILAKNGITSNQEVIRRWIRQGKFESSIKLSNKQGWLVEDTEIKQFVKDNATKQKSSNKTLLKEYKRGFNAGREAEKQAYHRRIKDILYRGYESQGKILRADFFQLTTVKSDDFKAFVDKFVFCNGVAKPRKSVEYIEIDGIYRFYHFGIVDTWEDGYREVIDSEVAKEENARRILEKRLYADYMSVR